MLCWVVGAGLLVILHPSLLSCPRVGWGREFAQEIPGTQAKLSMVSINCPVAGEVPGMALEDGSVYKSTCFVSMRTGV